MPSEMPSHLLCDSASKDSVWWSLRGYGVEGVDSGLEADTLICRRRVGGCQSGVRRGGRSGWELSGGGASGEDYERRVSGAARVKSFLGMVGGGCSTAFEVMHGGEVQDRRLMTKQCHERGTRLDLE